MNRRQNCRESRPATYPTIRQTTRPRLAALLVGVSALALGASPAWAEFRLNILHLNDPHSRIEPINRFDSTCSAEDDAAGECFGGFARLKTAIEARREALEGPTVTISAGDHFQGSLFYTTYKGRGEAEMAEAIGVELMTVGNHEFDDGPDELAAFLDGVTFPVLGANVDATGVEGVEGFVDPYVIAEFDDGEGGVARVGFVGVVASDTAETSSPGPIEIGDDLAALRDAVAELTTEGVNKIVAVTHVGLARDRELAAAVPEIDLIIGGHSHTLMLNEGDDAEGAEPYPVVVNEDTPIVQAYAYGKYLGEMVLRFDDEGNLLSLAGDPILIDASFEPDEALAARIAEMLGPIEELKATVVGEATAAIDGDRTSCRAGECEMGNLVADAMLDRVADQGIEIAIQNGGGLRASIDAGEITMGEVLTVLPFQNTLATFRLSGADIVASLEQGVGRIEEGAGRFPQVAGMSFALDPAAEPGSRVSDVTVGGEPIDPARLYGVVSNNFMRSGGDGYALFETEAEDAYDFGPGLEEVLADYIARTGPVTPAIDGRIRMAGADDVAMADEAVAEAVDEAASTEVADATEDAATEDAATEDAIAHAATAELEAADAAAAINEAVEGSTELDPLAEPPVVADATGPDTDTGADADADADEPIEFRTVEVVSGDAAEGEAEATPELTAEAIADAVPAPTADTQAVQDAVEEIAGATQDGAGDEAGDKAGSADDGTDVADAAPTAEAIERAAAAINEAVEDTTELAPLAEPPVVADAVEAVDDASDAPVADAETAIEEAVEVPTAETEAVQDDVEAVSEVAEAAVADINDAVESATELDPLAGPPTVADGAATSDAEATIEEAVEAPAAETEAVQDAVEEIADTIAPGNAAEAIERAAAAINETVEDTTEPDPLAEPPVVADAVEAVGDAADEPVADAEAAIEEAVEAPAANTAEVQDAVEPLDEVAEAAVADINEAVERATELDPLAEPPTVADASTAAPAEADESDAAAAAGVTDAEPLTAEEVEAAATDDVADDAADEVASDATMSDATMSDSDAEAEVAEAVPAPSTDTEAVQDAVEEIAEATGEAPEEATEATGSDEAAMGEADAVSVAEEGAGEDATDAEAEAPAGTVATEASVAAETSVAVEASGELASDDGEAADGADAPVEEVPTADAPTADAPTDEASIDEAVAESAINEAVESTTEFNPLAEPPVVASDDTTTADDAVTTDDALADDASMEAVDDASDDAAASDMADGAEGMADASTDDDAAFAADAATGVGDPTADEVGTDASAADAEDAVASDETASGDTDSAGSVPDDDATAASDEAVAEDATASDPAVDDSTDAADAEATAADAASGSEIEAAGDATSDEAASDEVVAEDAAGEALEEAVEDVVEDAVPDAPTDVAADNATAEPEPVADAAPADDAPDPRTHTVQVGDTLWDLAGEFYGDPTLFTLIEEANEVEVRDMRPGTELVIPERPE